MVKPGWLEEQFNEVEKEVKKWPHWMRREAGLEDEKDKKSAPDEKAGGCDVRLRSNS